MKVTRRSPITGKDHTLHIDVTQEQLDKWRDGELIQHVMPHLAPHEREFIMSGLTDEEFKKLWSHGENDDQSK